MTRTFPARSSIATGFGLALASTSIVGCVSEADDDLVCLPGDIDCADDGGADGKGDAWDYQNDPRRLSQHLTYRLAELPRQGRLEQPVWANRYAPQAGDPVMWSDTYWPTQQGSANARWRGRDVKSPLEKYDEAFNGHAGCEQPARRCGPDAKSEWDTYLGCAGPAARWQSSTFQGSRRMYDGVDSDGDGQIDECGDGDGIAGWWGLCHAWAPAALLEPEPQRAVTYNGVTFEVADIKGLIQVLYDRSEALMLGGRCNSETFPTGPNGERLIPPECEDVNPGSLHVILGNFLGLNDQALVMDKTAGIEVWNQPIYAYDVRKQDLVDEATANRCIGDAGDTYRRNARARELYEVRVDVRYLIEGSASVRPLGMNGYLSTDSYHYILEVDAAGKIIGGTYCTDSIEHHPDFLWAPIRVSPSNQGRNPAVHLDKVRTLIELSRRTDDGGGTTEGRTYQASGSAAIPDNDPAGASLSIEVPDRFTARGLAVTVDITHTWRGDLRVSLLHDGALVKVLHDRQGGSAHDLHETYTLTGADLAGRGPQGTWILQVVDAAAQDTGTIDGFKLTFQE
jgi:hypothetical protein